METNQKSFSNFGKSKSFDRRDDSRRDKDKNYLRVESGSRASKRVQIRRSRLPWFVLTNQIIFSSVEIIRPKRLSSGAKDLKHRERRKRFVVHCCGFLDLSLYLSYVLFRLGTDTSSGSNRSKKTTSSSSSVQKHLPKYIQSLFRGRMGTDPCKRHTRSIFLLKMGSIHFQEIRMTVIPADQMQSLNLRENFKIIH